MLAPWILNAGRALLALVLGMAITFTAGHTAQFGLIAFGAYAVVAGLWLLLGWFGPRAAGTGRTAFRAAGVVSVLAGIAALVLPSGGIGYFVWVVSGWAIITGALELVTGIRARGTVTGWTDWITVGGLTVVLGIVMLVIPPDISDAFSGDKGVQGLLTSAIILVGALGAWAVITGVLQAIAAASPKLAARGAGRTGSPVTASGATASGTTASGVER